MGDRWRLFLGRDLIIQGKNELPAKLMTIFQEEDRYEDPVWLPD